jgi:altronate dehydratase
MLKAIIINPKDNVATVINHITSGKIVQVQSSSGEVVCELQATEAIPFGHKIALTDIENHDEILKYGEVMGLATKVIKKGDYVHTHNVRSCLLPGSN